MAQPRTTEPGDLSPRRRLATEDGGEEATSGPERLSPEGLGLEGLGLEALARLMEASLDGIAVADGERHFLYLNPAAGEILGYPREELLGQDFLRIFPPRQRRLVLERFAELRAGDSRRESAIVVRADGEERELDTARMHIDVQGRPLVAAIFRDVTETRRLSREAAALAQVASSVAGAGSLEATLDALATSVVEATRAVACSVVLVDPEVDTFRVVGSAGLPEGYAEAMLAASRAGARSFAQRAFRSRQPLLVHNARALLLASRLHAPVHPFLRRAAWDTIVVAPLIYRGRGLGAVNAYYLADRHPRDDEVALLGAIADQAAVAVENARLRAQAEQRLQGLEALYRADEELYRSLQLDRVLQALVDVATDILHADKTAVLVWDARHERLIVAAARNFLPETAAHVSFRPGEGIVGRTAVSGEAIAVEDARTDPRIPPNIREIVGPEGIRSLICAPITVDGQVFAVFSVNYCRPHAVGTEEQRLLVALAQRAGQAIENARLYGQAQHAAALEERQRLARELHDSGSQAVYGIALGARPARTLLDRDPARVAEPLDYVLQLAEAGLAEMRALIFELRPESLEQEGLVAALDKQADALRARHGIDARAVLCDEPDVPLELKEPLYRIAREALHNTVKHARASRVELRLECGPEEIALEVADDGVGFDPSGEFPGHLGLRSMRERSTAFGGSLEVESAPGRGTRVHVRVPRSTAAPRSDS